MTAVPDLVSAKVSFDADRLADALRVALRAVRASGLAEPTAWASPPDAAPVPLAPDGMPTGVPSDFPHTAALLHLEDGDTVAVALAHGQRFWEIDVLEQVPKDSDDAVPSVLTAIQPLFAHMLEEPRTRGGATSWKGPGAQCLPGPPLVGMRSQLVLVCDEDVAASYDDPAAFWNAGWADVRRPGRRALLARALDARDALDLLAVLQGPQWALARAAAPGLTQYVFPTPTPEEEEIYRSGERALEMVGYLPGERTVELSAVLGEDDHVNGWEILDLWDLVQEGALPEGQPVERVRVVFLEEAAAQREKRPLLDVGCEVHFYDDEGELRPLIR